MKKRICILMICCLIFGITACQNTGDIPRSDSSPGESSSVISEKSDMQTIDNEQPEETVQQQEEQPPEETDEQQSDNSNPIVYMTTDISPEGLTYMKHWVLIRRERLRSRLLRVSRGATI